MDRKLGSQVTDINNFKNGGLPMNETAIITEPEKATKPTKNLRNSNHSTTYNSRYLSDYPDVLTPTECQNILLVGRNTIYNLLQNNIIKSVKIGKQYRIPKSSLQNYLNLCYSNECIDNSASA